METVRTMFTTSQTIFQNLLCSFGFQVNFKLNLYATLS